MIFMRRMRPLELLRALRPRPRRGEVIDFEEFKELIQRIEEKFASLRYESEVESPGAGLLSLSRGV